MKIDLQIHSVYSSWKLYRKNSPWYTSILDSTLKIDNILKQSQKVGLGAISITDHGVDYAEKYLKGRKLEPLFIRGAEIKTNLGEVLVFGNLDNLPLENVDFYDFSESARSNKCLLIAPHPFLNHPNGYNGIFSLTNKQKNVDLKRISTLIDGVCCYNQFVGIDQKIVDFANEFGLVKVATSDSHYISQIGSAWVEIDDSKSEADILESIKRNEIKELFGSKLNPIHLAPEAIYSQFIGYYKSYDEFKIFNKNTTNK